MEFVKEQKTVSPEYKKAIDVKFYNDKLYYVWQEHDINDIYQIWGAIMNKDGSNFSKFLLTTGTNNLRSPKLCIYNNQIYVAGYGFIDGVTSVWVGNMDINMSNLHFIFVSDHEDGAIKPEIAIDNDIIYLTYLVSHYNSNQYRHMAYARLNLDGTNFVSYTASNTLNEIVDNAKLFISGDKIYYMWRRNYFIGDPTSLQLYSANKDLTEFTRIITIADAVASNLYVKNNKIYFTWSGNCSIINTDGTEHEEILFDSDNYYTQVQVTTNNGDDIIHFALTKQISAEYPYKTYTINSATYNINTREYIEINLANDITVGFNYNPELKDIKTDTNTYYIWDQLDADNYSQIWTGILSESTTNGTNGGTVLAATGGLLLLLLLMGNNDEDDMEEYLKHR